MMEYSKVPRFLLLLFINIRFQPSWTFLSLNAIPTRQSTSRNTASDDTEHSSPFPYQPLLRSIHQSSIRSSLNSTEAFRVFHGRGGCYPGCEHLTLDWFPPVWVLTSFQNKPLSKQDLTVVDKALQDQWKAPPTTISTPLTWVYQSRGNQANVTTTVMTGTIPDPHVVTENGCQYSIQTTADDGGRKHRGLFLDMVNGRKWIQENSGNKKILNLFSYTCGFSIAALAAQEPAKEVINMDKVAGVLKLGQRNHDLNGIASGKARFLSHDIFKSWGKLKRLGPYDIVVVDPPSFQKGSFVASKDYGKLIRRLPGLLTTTTKGNVLLCLNAPELGVKWLEEQVTENAPRLTLVKRIHNPDSFPVIDEDRALKVLLYEMEAEDVIYD